MEKSVINLSNKSLSVNHLYAFYLGASFSPTPKLPNIMKFNDDLNCWFNKLRYTYNFSKFRHKIDTNNSTPDLPSSSVETTHLERCLIKHQANPNIETKATNSPSLELFIQKIKEEVGNFKHSYKKSLPSNLDKETMAAINEMKQWEDTVIRPFDKGSGFVVLSKEEYIKKVYKELNDASTFEKILNIDEAIQNCKNDITLWLEKYLDEAGMTNKITKWVYPSENCTPGNNYINIKAHKPDKNYPGRLISASCNGFTNNLATLTVHELRKTQLAYNLRDTNHFLQKVENINNSGILQKYDKIFMVSFDITSMFPSITKSHGLSACKEHLDKRINPLFSTQCIIEAINITLEHNITSFNGEFFRQIKGTAMGAKNACDYADISMSKLDQYIHEEDLLSKHSIKPPVMFERFRDDIFAILTDEDSIDRCFNLINSFYDNIKFTMSQPSNIGIDFLDTFVSFQDYQLSTRPFSKSCDSHCYLTPKSCHPTHILENIPYSIAHRVFKISSDDKIYNASKSEYSKYLKARGYSAEITDTSFKEGRIFVSCRNDL